MMNSIIIHWKFWTSCAFVCDESSATKTLEYTHFAVTTIGALPMPSLHKALGYFARIRGAMEFGKRSGEYVSPLLRQSSLNWSIHTPLLRDQIRFGVIENTESESLWNGEAVMGSVPDPQ